MVVVVGSGSAVDSRRNRHRSHRNRFDMRPYQRRCHGRLESERLSMKNLTRQEKARRRNNVAQYNPSTCLPHTPRWLAQQRALGIRRPRFNLVRIR